MKTGIIGLGKMGGALLRGMLKAGAAVPEEVWVYAVSYTHLTLPTTSRV